MMLLLIYRQDVYKGLRGDVIYRRDVYKGLRGDDISYLWEGCV